MLLTHLQQIIELKLHLPILTVKKQLRHSIDSSFIHRVARCQFPEALISPTAQFTGQSQIYIWSPVMDRSHMYNLWWQTCQQALREMRIQPSHKCLVYFPKERDTGLSTPPLYSLLDGGWGAYAAERKKEAEASNRLLDVRGHLVPEAEVVYIYLSPFLSLVSLSFSLEGGAHSLPLPTSTIGDLWIQTGDLPGNGRKKKKKWLL